MSFALYRRPGCVIFLDDDRDYLAMLGAVLPAQWHIRLFSKPIKCIDLLHQEIALRDIDLWAQQDIVNRWREGVLLIPEILQYWHDDGMERFGFAQVSVVDYVMPDMSGLRMLSELTRWPGSRILLTGRADEQTAVSAFNRGLINQFIPKQSPDIRLRLTTSIQGLRDHADERHQHIWRSTLTPGQHMLLSDPLVSWELENIVLRQGWIEHVVIGAPFGVLALDARGIVSWLQLETVDSLPMLAEIALRLGWDKTIVQAIRAGTMLLDLKLHHALGDSHRPGPRESLIIAGKDELLYAAIFPINISFAPGPEKSHEQFLASQEQRIEQLD